MHTCQFERNEILLGVNSTQALKNSAVAVFGVGGVGGSLAEALARAGIGRFLLVDFDKVALSNINRQIIATHSTVGRLKADCMKGRILDINPDANVAIKPIRISAENINEIDFSGFDYIADAVDDVAAKIEIIKKAKADNIRIISCMGAGNRLRARFLAADISKTYGCPLAKKVRDGLKKQGITDVKAVFCPDSPIKHSVSPFDTPSLTAKTESPLKSTGIERGNIIGSVPFIPPAAGLFMAGEIILDLVNAE